MYIVCNLDILYDLHICSYQLFCKVFIIIIIIMIIINTIVTVTELYNWSVREETQKKWGV